MYLSHPLYFSFYSHAIVIIVSSDFFSCSPDIPSPPRNLRYSVVGTIGEREIRVFWSASCFTGGLPVNYSMKLCVNDSSVNENICKWNFSDPDCRSANVLRTDKDFLCVLKKQGDFISPCGKACNYALYVVAENAVGSATSWRYLPFIPVYSGNVPCVGICLMSLGCGTCTYCPQRSIIKLKF